MKGLILSGGKGTRLYPLTHTRSKHLLPLANQPILFYAIEALIKADIHEIGIVVGHTHKEIEASIASVLSWDPKTNVRFTYIYQDTPLGLAHAIKLAQPFLGLDRFVVFLGDNLIRDSLKPMVNYFSAPDCPDQCVVSLTEVSDPTQFGIAEIGMTADIFASNGLALFQVCRLTEKPAIPLSNLGLVGVYCFDPFIFRAIDAIQPSARGELEITDAIQWCIEQNYNVRAHRLQGYWIDTGSIENILEANRYMLIQLTSAINPASVVVANSTLLGKVILEEGAIVENSLVHGPTIIGKNACVRNAYIGPFTSIYHNATIEASKVENSILLEYSKVIGLHGQIKDSLIGRHTEVRTTALELKEHKLLLGDHSRIEVA